tara:strand:- start:243 stop:1001 length:759 start_codon:yes stop_codon:yes gene_type:complete
MKVAFCISGLFKPSGTYSTAYENKFAYLTNKIKKYNADTFIYSFSKEMESEVIDIFKPKSSEFKVQKEFADEISAIDSILDTQTAKKVFSMFYSRKKVCELRKKFEKENNTNYDVVVLCRPDLGYIFTENFEIPNLSKIENDYLYTMYWNQFNAGIPDWLFISNPSNIDFLSEIYERLPSYLDANSEYKKSITTGFPYSNSESRFSQEIFKNSPLHSEKIDKIYMLNQHVLLKHYLLENNKFSLDFLKFSSD